MQQTNKRNSFVSEEERKWLLEQEQPYEVRKKLNHIEEYIDYDERYEDYIREEIVERSNEDRERWLSILKKDRERMNDIQWESRKKEINIMIDEGIIDKYITNIITYIETTHK